MVLDAFSKIGRWREEPGMFVREVFGVTPTKWQDEVLAAFPYSPRIAMLAPQCAGKTAVEAWLCWNFLVTRPESNIAAVSVTWGKLRDGLWRMMAYWQSKSSLLQNAFDLKATRIEMKEAPALRWMSARAWPETGSRIEQAKTLAGLQAPHVMFVLDESDIIPDAVLVGAEDALSRCEEGHIVQGGDGSKGRNGAALDRAQVFPERWRVFQFSGVPLKRGPA
jgi:phage terminase large subunit